MFLRSLRSDSIKQIAAITLFLILALENSSAQEVLKINSIEQANAQIENYIYLYVDTTNSLDITQILNNKEQNLFLPLNHFKDKISSKNTYWLYFSIENNFKRDYPIGLEIPLQNHLVDVYSYSDSIINTQKTGLFLDGEKNDEILPFTNIIQEKGAKRTNFYLKIKNINDELPLFSIKFVSLAKAIKQNSRQIIFDGFANGIMWLMIFYGLIMFFLNKDKLYLYYSIYIILCSTGPAIWGGCVTRRSIRAGSWYFSHKAVTVQGGYGALFAVMVQILLRAGAIAVQF